MFKRLLGRSKPTVPVVIDVTAPRGRSVRIIAMRHGTALGRDGLSQAGIDHTRAQAKWLADRLADTPVRIFSSPELRAVATANELKWVFGSDTQVTIDKQLGLLSEPAARKLAKIARANRSRTLILVTHEPVIHQLYRLAGASHEISSSIPESSFHFFEFYLVSLTLQLSDRLSLPGTNPDES